MCVYLMSRGSEVLTYESVQENCQDFLGRFMFFLGILNVAMNDEWLSQLVIRLLCSVITKIRLVSYYRFDWYYGRWLRKNMTKIL